jgi:hypothetical protein
MELYILNQQYEIIGFIDQADSVLWNKKYNGVGECEIYVPCDVNMLQLLNIGNYVYRANDDMFCKILKRDIETDKEKGDYIVATATDIATILSNRIVRWSITFSGTVFNFIKKLLEDNVINTEQTARKISNFEFDYSNESEFTETIEVTSFTEDLLQLIQTTCQTYNYGFRVSFDLYNNKLVFRLYKGVNKAIRTNNEYVEFSPSYANIISSNYEEDESNYKNVVYVSYENTAGEVHLLSLYRGDEEPTGEDRKEIYVDGTSTSRSITYEELLQMFPDLFLDGSTYYSTIKGNDIAVATSDTSGEEEKITVTDDTYLLLIRIIGENTLSDHVKTQEFKGSIDTIDTYEYKTDYDLGDIVKVINDYGIEAEARITEIMESDDNEDGHVIEPTFEYIN